ncbi:hypothetical protein [Rhodohalobacter barkolensis]|uniref:Uncharacterized protein n=1 Tax=Rhodohalobacter barkolensis TaxID=2053187 RepID=A0A2N0VEC1_9BACT|nr:hypothetical protein [Rhodohalobacter barkolensis]PKD42533.1 hypothetical protein CWD77_14060 [Rhodohalobacter barkolensis]
MNSLRFTGDDKYAKIYYLIMILLGLFVLSEVVYNYQGLGLDIELFAAIFLGVYAVVAGSSVIFGNKKPLSAIIIDDEKISSENPLESSFTWAYLEKVELEKKKINLQYAKTGITGSMKIPFTLRFKNLDRLSTTLSETCNRKEIEFVNKLDKNN